MHLQRKNEDGIADVSFAYRLGSRRTEAGGTPALPGFVARRALLSFKLASSTTAYLPNAALGHDAWASTPNGKTVCCGIDAGGGMKVSGGWEAIWCLRRIASICFRTLAP